MPKEINMHTLQGEYIEKRALRRFSTAVRQLAETDGLPYMSDESFVASDPEMADVPNQPFGVYSEKGNEEEGKYAFVWFNERAKSALTSVHPDYHNLQAQVTFAHDVDQGSVSGVVRLYTYRSGEGDISLSMYGYLADSDRNTDYRLFKLCQRLGLGAMYNEVSFTAGQGVEQGFEGGIDSRIAWGMAHALEDLITTGES